MTTVSEDIAEALYGRTADMTGDGYFFSWVDKRSRGNGTEAALAGVDGEALLAVVWREEEASPYAGQGVYHLSANVTVYGSCEYDMDVELDRQDWEVLAASRRMVRDIRTAFGSQWAAFCAAGGQEISYIREILIDPVSGHRVEVGCEFRIKWTENR
jgi:hypothetical protein